MSQRNPMNDRYQSDEPLGKTRKSAASAKPKTKAAASVRVEPAKKPQKAVKAERKALEKSERAKRAEFDRKYYHPPTPEYKRMRRIWWVLLISGIACALLSGVTRMFVDEMLSNILLFTTYAFIIVALFIDFVKLKKLRTEYGEAMESKKLSKEERAAEKKQKGAKKDAPEAAAAEEAPKKRGLFGSGFRLSKDQANKQEKPGDEQASSDPKDDVNKQPEASIASK